MLYCKHRKQQFFISNEDLHSFSAIAENIFENYLKGVSYEKVHRNRQL
jgi:hypothetical protein